jgi:hypothetical protein
MRRLASFAIAAVACGEHAGTTVESATAAATNTTTAGGDVTRTSTEVDSGDADTAPTLPACPQFDAGGATAIVAEPAIVEASGLAISRTHPGVFWLHNDSGDGARAFAIDPTGATLAKITIGGASALDWEDMALGPGPVAGVDYLYFGDIGDNAELRPTITVYRVREPNPALGDATLDDAVALTLDYPDGSHDAETLLIDPANGDLVIVTKREDGPSAVMYAPAPHAEGTTIELVQIGDLAFGSASLPGSRLATGGDISSDGGTIAIRTYDAVFAWRRPAGATLAEAFAGAPCPLPMVAEPQGEALGFGGDAYFTVSEGEHPTLWRFAPQ